MEALKNTMARKANISREEIILACWALIEQNYFPNIPRLSEYFIKLDGRKCSNTTLLKGITEWEELYKERQESSFKSITEHLMPSFKKFERDIGRDLEILLEEQLQQKQLADNLKQDAANGQYLSLSALVEEQAERIEAQSNELTACQQVLQENKAQASHFEKRYKETLASLHIAQNTNQELTAQVKELDLELMQKEVDSNKLASQLEAEKTKNQALEQYLDKLEKQIVQLEKTQGSALSHLTQQIDQLILSSNEQMGDGKIAKATSTKK